MTRFFKALLIAICLNAAAYSVQAQTETDFVTVPSYDMLVRLAIEQRPKRFEFSNLRMYYPGTPQYDPVGEKTRKKVVALAYTIDNDPDPVKRKKAFDEYGELIAAHLANIDVISQALVLSRQDKLYGDPKFFEWVRNGLLRAMVNTGTGADLTLAYNVITLGEEPFLMNVLRLQVLKTETAEEGGIYYNMHQVKDPKYPEPYWMFVDVSQPVRFLQKQDVEKVNTFSIRHE